MITYQTNLETPSVVLSLQAPVSVIKIHDS